MVSTQEYASLSNVVYYDGGQPPPGWSRLEGSLGAVGDEETGFYAEAWQNDCGDIVIAVRGTDNGLGVLADGQLALGATPTQFPSLVSYYTTLSNMYPDATISATGHSLGGGLVQLLDAYLLITNNSQIHAETFEAPGMMRVAMNLLNVNGEDLASCDVVNYMRLGDVVPLVGSEIGSNQFLPPSFNIDLAISSTGTPLPYLQLLNIMKAEHSMQQISDYIAGAGDGAITISAILQQGISSGISSISDSIGNISNMVTSEVQQVSGEVSGLANQFTTSLNEISNTISSGIQQISGEASGFLNQFELEYSHSIDTISWMIGKEKDFFGNYESYGDYFINWVDNNADIAASGYSQNDIGELLANECTVTQDSGGNFVLGENGSWLGLGCGVGNSEFVSNADGSCWDQTSNNATGYVSYESNNADGSWWSYSNDGQGDISEHISNADGSSCGYYSNDSQGEVIEQASNADGSWWSYYNDGQGEISEYVSNADKSWWNYYSDAPGNISYVSGNADGSGLDYINDGQGDISECVSNADGSWWNYCSDALGDVTYNAKNSDGSEDGYTNIVNGDQIDYEQDAAGNRTTYLCNDDSVILESPCPPASSYDSPSYGSGAYIDGNSLYAGTTNDTIYAGSGDDCLYGSSGNDELYGGSGMDTMYAGSGNEILVCGTGDDVMYAGSGNDTFVWMGSNNDTIYVTNSSGGKTLVDFSEGISENSIAFSLVGGDLILQNQANGAVWSMADWSNNSQSSSFVFADGTMDVAVAEDANTLELYSCNDDSMIVESSSSAAVGGDIGAIIDGNALYAGTTDDTIYAGSGSDSLYGSSGNDILFSGNGNDVMYAGSGNDTFVWMGSNNDTIYEGTGSSQGQTVVGFGEGVSENSITFSLVGGDLVLQNQASGAVWSMEDWSSNTQPSNFIFADGTMDVAVAADANTLELYSCNDGSMIVESSSSAATGAMIAGNALYAGTTNDTIYAGSGSDSLYGSSGNDILVSGTGDDVMYAGSGNNTFVWMGSNSDTIYEGTSSSQGQTLVSFGEGVSENSIAFCLVGGDLVLQNQVNAAVWSMAGWINNAQTSNFLFADGTMDVAAAVDANTLELYSSNDDGSMIVESSSLVAMGSGIGAIIDGNTLYAGTTDDTIYAGSGSDSLYGSSGNDELYGGSGMDTMYAGSSNDILVSGAGDDVMYAGNGNDTFVWMGSNNDTIYEGAGNISGQDMVDFGEGISENTIAFSLVGNDLVIQNQTGGGILTLAGWGNGTSSQMSQFLFPDGTLYTTSQNGNIGPMIGVVGDDGSDATYSCDSGDNLVQAGNGNDTLYGGSGVNYLVGGTGNDVFVAGSGNGYFIGGTDNNTYNWNVSAGNDIIFESSAQSNIVEFGSGIAENSLEYLISGNDLVIENQTVENSLTLSDWFSNGSTDSQNTTFEFSDGTSYTGQQINNMAQYILNDGQAIQGIDNVNYEVTFGSGNETFYAGNGNNTLYGGSGNDYLGAGSGNDALYGGSGNDTLAGGFGNTLQVAGIGSDYLQGGIGNDTYEISSSSGNDTINAFASGKTGQDTLQFGSDILEGNMQYVIINSDLLLENQTDGQITTLASWFNGPDSTVGSIQYADGTTYTAQQLNNSGMEQYLLFGNEIVDGVNNANYAVQFSSGNENFVAGNGNDTLTGGSGNDTLIAGSGIDTLIGGSGNDTFVINNASDVINAGTGTNTVDSSINYTLGTGLQNLTLTGTANLTGAGNSLSNVVTGNVGNDTLTGGSGNDTLIAGSGIDTLIGGSGNDTFVINNASDVIIAGQGTNLINSDIDYILGTGLQNLTLTGIANLTGTGNSLNNVLTGNAGNDTLTGGSGNDTLIAGSGIDTLIGGSGNDIFEISNASDVIKAGTGTNTVDSSISYTLGAGLQNLMLTGTANLTGMGNSLNDVINGNAGKDTLTGGSGNDMLIAGSGIDTLIGGTGNDTFVINSASDVIKVGTGTNTVESSINYTLGAGLQNLRLTGTANLTGMGNSLNNVLTCNAGNDTLTGGSGNDIIYGGMGTDYLHAGTGNDTINAGGGTDTLYGNTGNAEFVTGTGSDYMYAGSGSDTFVWGAGAGNDTINTDSSYDKDLRGQDTVVFGAGVTENMLNYQISGNNLVVENQTNGTNLTMLNWFAGNADQVDSFQFADGTNDSAQQINNGMATYDLASGNQSVIGVSGYTYTAYCGSGNDTFTAGNGNDTIYGGAGNDYLHAGTGNDTINAGSDMDTLYGSTGNTKFVTGTGNGYLYAGSGSDTFVWGAGAGNDTINTNSSYDKDLRGQDTVVFGAGVTENMLNYQISGNNLVVENQTNGTNLTMLNWFVGNADQVDNFQFTDGTSYSAQQMNNGIAAYYLSSGNQAVTGLNGCNYAAYCGSGNDAFTAGNGDDTINAGSGMDTLYGNNSTTSNTEFVTSNGNAYMYAGSGNDTFMWGTGVGNDTINTNSSSDKDLRGQDSVVFGAGVTENMLNYQISGNNLVVENQTNGTNLTILNWFAGNADQVDSFQFVDGTNDSAQQINNGMATYDLASGNQSVTGVSGYSYTAYCGSGNDTFTAGNGNDTIYGGVGNDYLHAGAGNDTINAGSGMDTLYGSTGNTEFVTGTGDYLYAGSGSDTFVWGAGAGNDTINTNSSYDKDLRGQDTVVFGAGVTESMLNYQISGNNLLVENQTNGTALTVLNWLVGSADQVDSFQFADGTNDSAQQINNGMATYDLASGNQSVTGVSGYSYTAYCGSGNDTFTAGNGNDTIYGGAGNDYLHAGTGNDTIIAGSGKDTLYGNTGNDEFITGSGSDYLYGGSGNDTFVWQNGSGNDTINTDSSYSNSGQGHDTLQFQNLLLASVEFSHSNNNLICTVEQTGQTVTVANWCLGSSYQVGQMQFADGTLSSASINQKIS